MTIIALDCASKTGWAIIKDGRIIESGVQDFTKRRGESNGLMFLRFRKWLTDLIEAIGKVQVLAYEAAHHRGGAATEICVNLTGRVQEIAQQEEAECASVHTNTLKKWACGDGKAAKENMMAIAKIRLGRDPIDDNEADATLIGLWAWEQYGR